MHEPQVDLPRYREGFHAGRRDVDCLRRSGTCIKTWERSHRVLAEYGIRQATETPVCNIEEGWKTWSESIGWSNRTRRWLRRWRLRDIVFAIHLYTL